MRPHQIDDTGITPDIETAFGKAWRVDIETAEKTGGEPHATVAIWVIEAPWAHSIWHSYTLSLIHLRPVAGIPEPLIFLAGATHELHVMALDPDKPRADALRGTVALSALEPPNFAAQFTAEDDAAADRRIEDTVREVLAGVLSPDTDFIRQWVDRFGDNMLRKRAQRAAGEAVS